MAAAAAASVAIAFIVNRCLAKRQAKLLICGGGIAGLSAALALKKNKRNPVVLESRAELTEYGAGINVQPGAVEALSSSCGIPLNEIIEAGFVVKATSYYTADGRLVAKVKKGTVGTPQVSIHRAELLRLLKEHAYKAGIPIQCSMRVTDLQKTPAGVALTTKAGATVEGACVMACDGVHSKVGKAVGKTGPICHSGVLMFRGVADNQAPFLDGQTMVLLGSMTKACGRLVVYPIAKQPNGKQQINWVLEVPAPSNADSPTADYDAVVPAAEVLKLARGLSSDFLDIPALIAASDRIGCWPMIDKDPYPSLVDDKVALLGDAAHPMYPVGSNGATSAILDGKAVAESFGVAGGEPLTPADIANAFKGYEKKRKAVVQAAQLSCRDMQADKVVDEAMEKHATGEIPAAYGEKIKDCLVHMQSRQRTQRNLFANTLGDDNNNDVLSAVAEAA